MYWGPGVGKSDHRLVSHDRWQVQLDLAGPRQCEEPANFAEVHWRSLDLGVGVIRGGRSMQARIEVLGLPVGCGQVASKRLQVVAVDREPPDQFFFGVGWQID